MPNLRVGKHRRPPYKGPKVDVECPTCYRKVRGGCPRCGSPHIAMRVGCEFDHETRCTDCGYIWEK